MLLIYGFLWYIIKHTFFKCGGIMSKTLILTEHKKKLAKIIPSDEKYIVSDSITDNTCDVICVSRDTDISFDAIKTLESALSDRTVVIGKTTKSSKFKKFIYGILGVSCGENNCGIVAIPSNHLDKITPDCKKRTVRLIKEAEEQKLSIHEVAISDSSRRGFFSFVADLFSLFLVSQPLKFLFSSGVAFILDYLLLIALNKQFASLSTVSFGSMEISAIIAWCISSLTNFTLNRYFVFKSNTPFWPSFAEYYGLAGAVFVLKTFVLLEVLTRVLHFRLEIAKLVAEVVFFISNYFIQKKLIFKHRPPTKDGSAN